MSLYILIVYLQVLNCPHGQKDFSFVVKTFLIRVSKENDISLILRDTVAFDGEINDSIKWRKENSVTQQDLTSTIEEDDVHIIPHVSQRMKVNNA